MRTTECVDSFYGITTHAVHVYTRRAFKPLGSEPAYGCGVSVSLVNVRGGLPSTRVSLLLIAESGRADAIAEAIEGFHDFGCALACAPSVAAASAALQETEFQAVLVGSAIVPANLVWIRSEFDFP